MTRTKRIILALAIPGLLIIGWTIFGGFWGERGFYNFESYMASISRIDLFTSFMIMVIIYFYLDIRSLRREIKELQKHIMMK